MPKKLYVDPCRSMRRTRLLLTMGAKLWFPVLQDISKQRIDDAVSFELDVAGCRWHYSQEYDWDRVSPQVPTHIVNTGRVIFLRYPDYWAVQNPVVCPLEVFPLDFVAALWANKGMRKDITIPGVYDDRFVSVTSVYHVHTQAGLNYMVCMLRKHRLL